MEIRKADVVKSLAGRDKDKLFYVFEIVDQNFAIIADGKLRQIEKPKMKKLKHLAFYTDKETVVRQKILLGEQVTNAQLREILNQINV